MTAEKITILLLTILKKVRTVLIRLVYIVFSLIFTNLVDFDIKYVHLIYPLAYAYSLEEFYGRMAVT